MIMWSGNYGRTSVNLIRYLICLLNSQFDQNGPKINQNPTIIRLSQFAIWRGNSKLGITGWDKWTDVSNDKGGYGWLNVSL